MKKIEFGQRVMKPKNIRIHKDDKEKLQVYMKEFEEKIYNKALKDFEQRCLNSFQFRGRFIDIDEIKLIAKELKK